MTHSISGLLNCDIAEQQNHLALLKTGSQACFMLR